MCARLSGDAGIEPWRPTSSTFNQDLEHFDLFDDFQAAPAVFRLARCVDRGARAGSGSAGSGAGQSLAQRADRRRRDLFGARNPAAARRGRRHGQCSGDRQRDGHRRPAHHRAARCAGHQARCARRARAIGGVDHRRRAGLHLLLGPRHALVRADDCRLQGRLAELRLQDHHQRGDRPAHAPHQRGRRQGRGVVRRLPFRWRLGQPRAQPGSHAVDRQRRCHGQVLSQRRRRCRRLRQAVQRQDAWPAGRVDPAGRAERELRPDHLVAG